MAEMTSYLLNQLLSTSAPPTSGVTFKNCTFSGGNISASNGTHTYGDQISLNTHYTFATFANATGTLEFKVESLDPKVVELLFNQAEDKWKPMENCLF